MKFDLQAIVFYGYWPRLTPQESQTGRTGLSERSNGGPSTNIESATGAGDAVLRIGRSRNVDQVAVAKGKVPSRSATCSRQSLVRGLRD